MKLTQDYRLIFSSLDTEVDYDQPLTSGNPYNTTEYQSTFWVGNFQYLVHFQGRRNPDSHEFSLCKGDGYDVVFKIEDWKFDSDEQMIEVVSRMAKKPLDRIGAQVYLSNLRRYGISNLGDSRAILSGVVDTIKKFVDIANPSCLVFDAYEPNRRKLYETMIKRLQKIINFDYESEVQGIVKEYLLYMKPKG